MTEGLNGFMADDEMHEKKKQKLSIFSFFVFPQINKSAALKQAWRERRKKTEKIAEMRQRK